MNQYFEHNKLRTFREEFSSIRDFLSWIRKERLETIICSDIDYVLYKYLNIDKDKIEEEKILMLEELERIQREELASWKNTDYKD